MTCSAPYATSKCLGSGGGMVAGLKLKGIDGRAPPGVEPAAQFDSTRENSPGPDTARIDRLIAFFLMLWMVVHGRSQFVETSAC